MDLTLLMTLRTTAGTEVSGQTWPEAMTYDTVKGRGTFIGTVDHGANLSPWTHYNLYIEGSGTGEPTGQIVIRCYAVIRGMYGY